MAINELTKNFLRTIKSTKSSIIDLFNIIKQSWKIKKKLSKLITNKIENMFRNLTKIGVYPEQNSWRWQWWIYFYVRGFF